MIDSWALLAVGCADVLPADDGSSLILNMFATFSHNKKKWHALSIFIHVNGAAKHFQVNGEQCPTMIFLHPKKGFVGIYI